MAAAVRGALVASRYLGLAIGMVMVTASYSCSDDEQAKPSPTGRVGTGRGAAGGGGGSAGGAVGGGGAVPSACSYVDLAAYLPEASSDTDAIHAASAAAQPGEAVYVPPGSYVIDGSLRLRSDVDLYGDPADPPLLEGLGEETVVIRHDVDAPLHDVTLQNLRFKNVAFRLYGNGSYGVIRNVTFRRCEFFDGKVSDAWVTPYISLPYTDRVVIEDCTFLRRSEAFGGRGVNLWRSHRTVVKDCHFGTTADLEPPTAHGYFRTAINVNGCTDDLALRPVEIRLQNNVARRVASPSCPFAGSGDPCQDHGMYVHCFDGLDLIGNRIDGWDLSAAGGALKLRNAENAKVLDNAFRTSGALLYTYEGHPVTYLRQLMLHRNRIDLGLGASPCPSGYCGVFYWRNFGLATDPGHEDALHVTNNRFVDGGHVRLSNALLDGFCIESNPGAGPVQTSGSGGTLATSGCLPEAAWSHPPAGLWSADFNGDGVEDSLYFARHRAEGPAWVGHMSNCYGFRFEQWGVDARFSAETNRYRPLVGDFDGDGQPDLVYRGQCGADDHPCWRVLRNEGHSLAARDFGDGAMFTAETLTYGVHAGDLDGDGRTDLVYRGSCDGGTPAPCFRVHLSDGSSFAATSFGNGAYFGPDSADLGMHVGDLDGDGRDDLLYRGRCGGDGHPCWRVHRSTGTAFAVSDWGDDASLAGETGHFGLRLGDVDQDGRVDLVYRGRCGTGEPRWRIHRSTGAGFVVDCRVDNPL